MEEDSAEVALEAAFVEVDFEEVLLVLGCLVERQVELLLEELGQRVLLRDHQVDRIDIVTIVLTDDSIGGDIIRGIIGGGTLPIGSVIGIDRGIMHRCMLVEG